MTTFSIGDATRAIVSFLTPIRTRCSIMRFFVRRFVSFIIRRRTIHYRDRARDLPKLLFLATHVFSSLLRGTPDRRQLATRRISIRIAIRSKVLGRRVSYLLTSFRFRSHPITIMLTLTHRAMVTNRIAHIHRIRTRDLRRNLTILRISKGILMRIFHRRFSINLWFFGVQRHVASFLFISFEIIHVLFWRRHSSFFS